MKHAPILLIAFPALASAQLSHEPAFELRGAADELFAQHVATAGDVDGDGSADIAVYAIADALPNGVVRVYSGRDGSRLRELPRVTNHPFLGHPFAGAGDLDGDGHAEMIVGDQLASIARVYSIARGTVLHKFEGDHLADGFGAAVARAGDVDRDGIEDLVVGTLPFIPGGEEYARVFSGADGSILHTLRPEARFLFASQSEQFGTAVSGAGDVDADGFSDVAVGATLDGMLVLNPGAPPFVPPFWSTDWSGSARVYSGRDGRLLDKAFGEREFLGFGFSLAGVGDWDADGHDDFAAGAINLEEPTLPGYAQVLSGLDGQPLATFLEDDQQGQMMVRVAAAGDLDGRGRPDLLVASRAAQGAARAFSGEDGSELFEFQSAGPVVADRYGVCGNADMNGDGTPDFAVAVVENHFGGGYVRVFHSQGARPSSLRAGSLTGLGRRMPASAAGCSPRAAAAPHPRSAQGPAGDHARS